MFKKVQFALVAACAVFSFAAHSTNTVAQWWTDHEPNHVTNPDGITQPDGEVLPDSWWTDHEPNHVVASDETDSETPAADVPQLWWTDHEPNH